MQDEWEGKRIARQFAGFIIKLWRSEGGKKSNMSDALQAAINHYYGSKEAFFETFLKYLSSKQLKQFYKLLHGYLEDFNNTMGGIDPKVLAAICQQMKDALVSGVESADANKSFAPSSNAGSRWSGTGKGGGRN